jgi:hypothetical protein
MKRDIPIKTVEWMDIRGNQTNESLFMYGIYNHIIIIIIIVISVTMLLLTIIKIIFI